MMDDKNSNRLSKEQIRTKLLDSTTINEVSASKDLNKEVDEVQDLEKASDIIKRNQDIIETKNKRIINVAYHQRQVFKRFKEKEKFTTLVTELGIHKNTIICRINLLKLCKKHPKLLKSSIGLGFLGTIIRTLKKFAKNMEKIFNVERFYLLKLSCYASFY